LERERRREIFLNSPAQDRFFLFFFEIKSTKKPNKEKEKQK